MGQKSPVTKTIQILAILIGAMAFAASYYYARQLFFKQPTAEQIMSESVADLNKNCPKLIDENSRLDSVHLLPGKVLQYNYTLVKLNKSVVNMDTVKKYMVLKIIKNAKINPELKIYRNNQATLNYIFNDKDGEYVLDVSVTPDMYQN